MECTWQQTKLQINHQMYLEKCHTISQLLPNTKQENYSTKTLECAQDQKALFRLTKNRMTQNGETWLPSHMMARSAETWLPSHMMARSAETWLPSHMTAQSGETWLPSHMMVSCVEVP